MPSAAFKFDKPEEQAAFAKLLSLIPRKHRWEDLETYPSGNICHICDNKVAVKSGIVPLDDFFEDKKLNSYTFWSCCLSCHNHGWTLPHFATRKGGMRYWRINSVDKTEERIITDSQIFKFPTVALLNTDTVLITV